MKHLLFFVCIILYWNTSAQQTDYVNFKSATVDLSFLDIDEGKIAGKVLYKFRILKDVDSIYIDAKNISHSETSLGDGVCEHINNGKHIIIKNKFKANTDGELLISWITTPRKAMYFVGWDNDAPNQIWTQGQGKYTSNWLPSIDDMNEKIEFDLSISFDKDYYVIANGKLDEKIEGDKNILWHYDMELPMPSYLVALAIGKYDKKIEMSESGIPLEMHYYPGDSLKFEPTYRYTKRMFDYLENEIGIAYPWQNYKQIPVHDFLYAGMENTGTTIFSDDYMIDETAFVDRNYVNVNAHELAHQWFGNLVTAKSGTHHWLQEGFATYYALLAERDIFGDDYFYWKLYESAQQLVQQDLSGQSTALLDPKSSSLTFYQKGAWTLYMLKEKVGEVAFKIAIKNYLLKFRFKNAETADFISEVELVSEQDLSGFVSVWLEDDKFPYDRALDALKQNSTLIDEYEMVDCEVENSKCDYYLISGISDEAKKKIIEQVPSKVNSEVFKSSIKVRQAIAHNVTKIPFKIKNQYESLLKDKSYATVEAALYNLWTNFPEDRAKYLQATKSAYGFNDYNIRMLWLALHLNTLEYEVDLKKVRLQELVSYTSEAYNAQTRMAAFSYLGMLKSCSEDCKKNLKEAVDHHNWQLTKFAKQMLAKD